MPIPTRTVSKDDMLKRVAYFKDLRSSARPLIDAVLPQYEREILAVIGGGVIEDEEVAAPITAVEGFHMSIVKAGPKKGTGLHNHRTVEVFMPLSGTWSVQWGDQGENELMLGPYDTISIPIHVMRGFRNESEHEALLLVVLGGTDPGRVEWTNEVLAAVREKGFSFDVDGRITEGAGRGTRP